MKKIFKSLLLIPAFAMALVGCSPEEIVFSHEQPGFDTQDGKILIEAILPTATAVDDEIYIAGPFAGDSTAVVGNSSYLLSHSTTVSQKWGIYLDPASFKDGKTLADGFYFVNVQQGIERSVKNEDILHTLDAQAGKSYNVYAERWRSFFETNTDVEETLPAHDGIRIYIVDETGWDAIALYQWGDVNDFGGGWPGSQVAGTATIAGKAYPYFEYDDDLMGLSQNLIFNNNGGGTQLADYAVTFDKADYFLKVTADGVEELDSPVGGVTLPAHDGFRVYITNNTSWDAIALYQWGDVNDFGGGWPGQAPSGTETIAGTEYTYFEYGDDAAGLSQNLIFNNNGGGIQLADYAITFEEADYFLNVTDDGVEALPNPATGGGGSVTPPEPKPIEYGGPKIYIQNKTGWPGKLYAHYWDGTNNTEWPGTEFETTETVEGVDYLVIETLAATKGKEVGIIFHSDEDDENNRFETTVTLDVDRYYVLEKDALTEVESGVRIIVKNNTGWPGNIYAHMWDDEGTFGTDWPGIAATGGYFDNATYLVFLTPKEAKGKTVNVIFHSDENDADNRFQTVITLDKDRFYVLDKEFTFAEEEKKPVNIYVDDQTGWDAIALYMWGDVNDLGGDWPGMQVTKTEEIMGTTYKVFTIPNSKGLAENLIFNNNGDGTQLADFALTFDKEEYFLVVTAEGVTLSERPSIDPAKRVTIYVDDQTGWDAIALYMWGDKELAGGWPGAQVNGTEEIAGTTYKTFVFENAIGLTEHLIFNNNGGGTQLADFDLTFSENEYYLKVTAEGVTNIGDPTMVTLYVDDQTGWDAIALYQWGAVNDLGGSWPGAQVSGTEDIAGTTYKIFKITGAMGLSQNLIFNNNGGSTQLADYAITFSKAEYFLKVTASGVEELADPR